MFYSQDHKEDLLYDAAQAQEMVLQWKAHILRAENQDLVKMDAVLSVQDDTAFILMDWAMKFTQMRYQEETIRVVWKARYKLAHQLRLVQTSRWRSFRAGVLCSTV